MTTTAAQAPARPRLAYLDKARGLAIALMILDHLLLVTSWGTPLRYTLTRAAMPLFFLVAGTLVWRLTWRHAAIGLAGLLLPLAVPWIDRPNVLVLYVVGAVLVVAYRHLLPLGSGMAVLAVLLTLAVNGYTRNGHGYDLALGPALVVCGALFTTVAFRWADRLPGWLAVLGRYPLSIYLGHLLVLQLAASLLHGSWLWWEGAR